MSRTLSLVGLLAVLVIGAYLYMRQTQEVSPGGGGDVRAAVDVAGVKNDLLAIANAERGYFALEGKYASLDELRAKGSLTMRADGRGPYTYSADIGASGFRIVATHSGPPSPGAPRTVSIDETMQLKTE